MLDIYQINPYLIGLLGQESLTDFELKNLSIEIEKISNNTLKEIKDFYLLELSIDWKKMLMINLKSKIKILLVNYI